MILVVDPHSGIPVYRQLVEQIRFNVASGVLKPGDEISSTRALSASLGINPMTISKAFVILEQDDVLERRPGRPHIVSESQGQKVLSTKYEQLEGPSENGIIFDVGIKGNVEEPWFPGGLSVKKLNDGENVDLKKLYDDHYFSNEEFLDFEHVIHLRKGIL